MRVATILLLACSSILAEEVKPYAQRVDEFWVWFRKNGAAIHKSLQDNKAIDWVDRISAQVEAVHPDFAWELRPSPVKGEESFVIYTGMPGAIDLLARRWLDGAPKVKGWRFLDHLPAGNPPALEIEGENYKAEEFVVQVRDRPNRRQFDVRIFHPRFARIDEKARYRVCFIWLDSVLGSRTSALRIGEILIAKQKPKGTARSMGMLRGELVARSGKLGWELAPDPTQAREFSRQIPGAPEGVRAWRVRDLEVSAEIVGAGVEIASIVLPNEGGKITQQGVDRTRAVEKVLPAALGKDAYVIGVSHHAAEDVIGLMIFDRAAATKSLKELLAGHEAVRTARLRVEGVKEPTVLK